MKIDSHILFLIVIIGVISAGIVGATVMNSDTSMKQEVFDGITVSVPVDSEFVKVDDGVYKDAKYGITINTFKNNDSMIDFLKNSKKSKIIPIDNQPPQSVAFKNGKTVNILVTNGNEGVSIGSYDGKLTSKIANNVIFSNNHKSEKPAALPFVKQPMVVDQDFNLIMLLVAEVDTKMFNLNMLQDNLVVVVDGYNEGLSQPVNNAESGDGSSEGLGDVSDISTQDDLNNALSGPDNTSTSSDNSKNNKSTGDNSKNDDDAKTTVVSSSDSSSSGSGSSAQSSSANQPSSSPSSSGSSSSSSSSSGSSSSSPSSSGSSSSGSSSGGSSSSSHQQKLSASKCEQLAQQLIVNHPEWSVDSSNYDTITDGYVFSIVDNTNMEVGKVTVDALTGNAEPDEVLKPML
ncbi:hypothetical protein [Methanobrevibacter sp. UBA212]|uniref:hypothetical protein n=1 Tax=Methanobrevibacter sp. UBA212 TaxID=1915476 RepID=UPI0026007A0E|nr:hypothetical protein [Methanobrevibacter sp. UBA212]MEE1149778.1 hypothetical protein [Methanobrevibacter sp.]